MRKPFGKYLDRAIPEYISRLSIPFSKFTGKSRFIWSGDHVFVHARNDCLLIFQLVKHPKGHECFTLEFGWSKRNRFPEVLTVKSPDVSAERHEFKLDEYLKRIGTFLDEDRWWWLEDYEERREYFLKHCHYPEYTSEEVSERVKKALDSAMEDVGKYVIPYFRGLIAYLDH